jgi:hypothetical protein
VRLVRSESVLPSRRSILIRRDEIDVRLHRPRSVLTKEGVSAVTVPRHDHRCEGGTQSHAKTREHKEGTSFSMRSGWRRRAGRPRAPWASSTTRPLRGVHHQALLREHSWTRQPGDRRGGGFRAAPARRGSAGGEDRRRRGPGSHAGRRISADGSAVCPSRAPSASVS